MNRQKKLDILFEQMRACRACRLRKTCKQVVAGEGPADANVAFFAEGPGASEDEAGRPLIGRSGQFWRMGLRRCGIDERSIFVSNAVKCRPPENRDPFLDEKEICWKWTIELLQIIRPKVIIPMGRHALEGFSKNFGFSIGQKGIQKIAGKAIYVADRNFYVFPMFHPAYALRNGTARDEFQAHLSFLRQAIPGWLQRPPPTEAEVAAFRQKREKKKKSVQRRTS